MCLLKSRHSWLIAPLLWLAGVCVLLLIGLAASPEWVQRNFDLDDTAPVQAATIGLFFLQIGFFWLVPPMPPGRRRTLLLADFSLLSFFAVCRQLDWHKLLVTASNLPGATRGTPFKMRFLTNPANPLADRLIVLACFVVVLALCGGTLAYYLPRLLKGLFRLHPVCWSVACFGGTVILVQLFDRLPAILRNDFGIRITDAQHALTTALEEGQELLLPLFVIVAVLQAHFIYACGPGDDAALARHRDL